MGLQSSYEKPLLLIFPFDLLSHYLRCIELAKCLRKDYQVMFAHSDAYSSFIKEEGFSTFRCKNFDPVMVMKCARNFDFSWLNKRGLEEIFVDQMRCLEELKPSIVLGDNSPTLKMASEKSGAKFVSLINGYMSKYYAEVRKLSITHKAYPHLKKLPPNVGNWITKTAEKVAFYQVHRPFKELRKKYSLSRVKSYPDELEGDLTLICDLPELFLQRNLPHHYKMIAPLFHTSSQFAPSNTLQLSREKKTILVSMGSSGEWNNVSFLNDHYYRKYNIITAGDTTETLKASHIIKQKFVNAGAVFPNVDLVICHGGNGTTNQALSFGIPVLCQTSHFEQEWNVHGLEEAGLGKSLNFIRDSSEVAKIIEEWAVRKNSLALQRIKMRIVEEIEKLRATTFIF